MLPAESLQSGEKPSKQTAQALKKYILTSSKETLKRKDEETQKDKGSNFFKTADEITRKDDYEQKYNKLINENELFFTLNIIKKINLYSLTAQASITNKIIVIIDICTETKNKHFLKFRNMINSHFEKIRAHATYKISDGKIEGLTTKLKL